MSHVPVRTCIGCRKKSTKSELVRLVRDPNGGTIVVDHDRRLSGRGAWVHQNDGCIRAAMSLARLERAFRGPVIVGQEPLSEVMSSVILG